MVNFTRNALNIHPKIRSEFQTSLIRIFDVAGGMLQLLWELTAEYWGFWYMQNNLKTVLLFLSKVTDELRTLLFVFGSFAIVANFLMNKIVCVLFEKFLLWESNYQALYGPLICTCMLLVHCISLQELKEKSWVLFALWFQAS